MRSPGLYSIPVALRDHDGIRTTWLSGSDCTGFNRMIVFSGSDGTGFNEIGMQGSYGNDFNRMIGLSESDAIFLTR